MWAGTTPKNFLLASLAVIYLCPHALLKLWRRPCAASRHWFHYSCRNPVTGRRRR